MTRRLAFALTLALAATPAPPQTATAAGVAPGAPGAPAFWTNADKQGVGTAVTLESKVWFTLGDGGLTEIYYPRVDVADTRRLELVVSDDAGLVESESEARHQVELVDGRALAFRQINTARSGRWRTTKTTFTDPRRSVVLVQVRFERLTGRPLRLFVFFDPAVANSGGHDTGYAQGGALLTEDAALGVALAAAPDFRHVTTGYLGTSDGLRELRAGQPLPAYTRASGGNVAQLAEIALPDGAAAFEFTLALGFASEGALALREARAALERPAGETLREYVAGWNEYLGTLRAVSGPFAAQYAMAAMQLKAHEDKTARGAMVASLTKPWGDEAPADEPSVGGSTTWSGRATCTTWPRRSRPWATRARPTARSSSCSRSSSAPTARSLRTRGSTGGPTGRRCSSTRWPTR
jgi:glucoamylase